MNQVKIIHYKRPLYIIGQKWLKTDLKVNARLRLKSKYLTDIYEPHLP